MSATTFPRRQAPAVSQARTARAAREPLPETVSDHGFLIKFVAGVLLVTATVPIMAQLGWAALSPAVAILLATTAAVIHAALRLVDQTDEQG